MCRPSFETHRAKKGAADPRGQVAPDLLKREMNLIPGTAVLADDQCLAMKNKNVLT